MKLFKYIVLALAAGLFVWSLLIILYYKSVSLPKDSIFSLSYKKTASPFFILNVLDYKEQKFTATDKKIRGFAEKHNMSFSHDVSSGIGGFIITLKDSEIKILVMNINNGNYLKVAFYQESPDGVTSQEKQDSLINDFSIIFSELNLKIEKITPN